MAANNDNAMNTSETTTAVTTPSTPNVNPFARFWNSIVHFLREVQVELKKTNWPTKNELTKFTIVVMITILVVSLFLFVADTVIAKIAAYVFHMQSTPSGSPSGF